MTQAFDAAVRAAEEAIEDPKRYAKYEDVARCIMCAALPAEPGMEVINLLEEAIFTANGDQDLWSTPPDLLAAKVRAFAAGNAYRAIRAYLLGESGE